MTLKEICALAGADKAILPTEMLSDQSVGHSKQTNRAKPNVKHPQTAKQVGYGVILYTQQPDGHGGSVVKPRFHTRPDEELDYETVSIIRDTYRSQGFRAVCFAIVEVDY